MPFLANFWNRIVEWFYDRKSRNNLILGFNRSSSEAFVQGLAPVLMKASIVKGYPPYKHSFSNFMGSGFRIKVLSGRQLSKNEIVSVGETILANDVLVRRMVVLGFDTLEIHCDIGNYGCRWQLKEYMLIGDGEE